MNTPLHPADAAPEARRDAFRDLCADYDPLLKPGGDDPGPAARGTLEDFAMVFDLSFAAEATAGDIWRQVRPLLAGQMTEASGGDDSGEAGARVFLPSARGLKDEPFADSLEPLSLLVVEDDPELAAGVVDALTEAGHRVVAVAANAEQAGSLAALHAIDFAILDVELEGEGDGVALADQLHTRWGLRALFVSGGANEHLVNHPAALGFVGKPFNAAELLAAVTLAAGLLKRRQG